MLSYERKKVQYVTHCDRHPDSKFANELGALHKYEISYIYIKNTFKNIKIM